METNYNPNENSCLSQNKSLVAYMLKGGKITSLEAVNMFGCMRLASRITDIKRMGYDVQSRFITTRSNKRVKEYWIDK